jgi:hypothetical protein
MSLSPQELDDLYTDLCYRMTEAGEAKTPEILARLALLLMNEVGDAARVRRAIDDALEGYPKVVAMERPL